MNSTATRRLFSRLALLSVFLASQAHAIAPDRATLDKIAKLSVPFAPNAGQWHERAAFAAQTFAGTLFVTKDGELIYRLSGKSLKASSGSFAPTGRLPDWVLRETLVDAKGKPRSMSESTLKAPAGLIPMDSKVSFAIGNAPLSHVNNLNTYERVNLGEMYPGINVQLRATGNNVEKIFTVAPKHDPKQIRLKLAGANKLEIGNQGELIASTGNGPVTFTAPIAFQENASGERIAVEVAYTIGARAHQETASEREPSQLYGFIVGEYDANLPLVIDPLLQSTYLGGSGTDYLHAIAIHPISGEIYVAGYTDSSDLPSVTTASGGVATGAQSVVSSVGDAFVARFNAALTARPQTSYFGGTGTDIAYALAIHPVTGEIYVAGHTNSGDLPSLTTASGGVAAGAQSVKSVGNDAFVARFNEALTAIPQVSYLGGSGDDYARAIAIHPTSGEVYVAGYTGSIDLPSATVASGGVSSGAQSVKASGNDAFIARFNAALTALPQTSYFGGNGFFDYAYALALHPTSGEVYIAGYTDSTDLPSVSVASGGVAAGAQTAKAQGLDAFVARFNPSLTASPQASYFGGSGTDIAYALAIHASTGEVYIAGSTDSGNLPGVTVASGGVASGAQSVKASSEDAFVVRFNAALTARPQATYFGGVGVDRAYALAIHPASGEVYLGGNTSSDDLPSTSVSSGAVASGAQSTNSFFGDTFVARLNAALTTRPQASYLGGASTEQAFGLAIHPATGEIYLAGYTQSSNLPSLTPASGGISTGAQSVKAVGNDAFVGRFSYDLALAALACNLDVDGSGGPPNASNDGVILLRAMLGLSDFAIVAGATSGSPPRDTWPSVRHYLNSSCGTNFAPVIRPAFVGTPCELDLDGSGGPPNAASDGLMLLRAMLGFTGTMVTDGAISGSPPRNTWPLIRDYLNQNCGTNFAP